MRILVVGDSYMPPRYFAEAFTELEATHELEYFQVDAARQFRPETPSERSLREFQGSPAELVERMRSGAVVALVSDAGMPLISDPASLFSAA